MLPLNLYRAKKELEECRSANWGAEMSVAAANNANLSMVLHDRLGQFIVEKKTYFLIVLLALVEIIGAQETLIWLEE
ncbi:hypothetical protein H5410_019346 [Solanum commersonii]|uniref:Uncharacterized protein n=1 Tax=Solanum commersonii TaxID=4109 RepID=A0A9J5Z5B4_SOLCO|nr:hypothetical protein H5410_019346 [Solanum commersonii]